LVKCALIIGGAVCLLDDVLFLKNAKNFVFSLAGNFKFLLLSFGASDHKLALLWLEVVAFRPGVFCPLGKFFFKTGDGIDLVEVLENFGLYLVSTYFTLSDPKKPLLFIVSLKQLHPNKAVSRGS